MTEYNIFKLTIIEEDDNGIIDKNDEWQEVYNYYLSNLELLYDNVYKFRPNYKFKNDNQMSNSESIYLQTYGGDPDGGFMIFPNGKVYSVDRNWGTPFNFIYIGNYNKGFDNIKFGAYGETIYCKLII